jgi:DNA-directed RNA polymerase subunit RPC12/RpoP
MAAATTAITAEWICSRCGVTNRKLAAPGATEVSDRCVHCGLKHTVRNVDSPVRWQATAA